jgi:hypothetical protein
MIEAPHQVRCELGAEEYVTPELIVHGTIAELTAGGTGPQKEVGAVGSFLPDGQDPI